MSVIEPILKIQSVAEGKSHGNVRRAPGSPPEVPGRYTKKTTKRQSTEPQYKVLHSVPGRAVANAVQTKLIRLPSGPEFIQIVDSADAMPVAHGPEGARLTIEFVGIDDVVRSPAPLISALTRSTPITLLDVVVVASKCSPQSCQGQS
eukprot:574835-Rhodomonas_salina.1